MVDLRATNVKLRARANRIVRQATGLDVTSAAELLESTNGDLKTALVSHLLGVDATTAKAYLLRANGHVRQALQTAQNEEISTGEDRLVIGIDGGGTRTTALLAQIDHDGHRKILGRGESGPGNRQTAGVDAFSCIDEAIQAAFSDAQLRRQTAAVICLGLAGAGRPEDRSLIRQWAEEHHIATIVEVTTDTDLLLAAGTPAGWGVAVVAGTGSMAIARNAEGQSVRAGGWGPLLGDEGSGYSLALAGLRAAVRAVDGWGPDTKMVQCFLKRTGIARPEELIGVVYRGGGRPALAALGNVVLEAAKDGDAVATMIVEEAARDLANAAATAAKAVRFSGPVPIALAGGMLTNYSDYRERIVTAMQQAGLILGTITLVRDPVEGAIRIAQKIESEQLQTLT
jgi:N-acetylglucosamine kinase-like BadF-type ATPase